jgi:hypothetical protein
MTERRLPAHLAVLVGISAGAYSIALAGVTALQSMADAAVIAQRRPAEQTADVAAQQHDAIDRSVAGVFERYARLVDRYDQVGIHLSVVEASLDDLATRAAGLSTSAATLRVTPFSLPRVSPSVPRSAPRPTTHATTRASGG